MKKIIALVLCCVMFVGVLFGCGSSDSGGGESTEIKVMLVDGAPLLSMAHLMSDGSAGVAGYNISYTMTNDSDMLVAALLNQEPDFAVAPINVAAMMNNNGSGYRLAAVPIWGLMHIVSDMDVSSLEDLKGEVVLAFGRSGTPGITLRAVLEQSNIPYDEPDDANFTPDPDKVSIIYLTAPSDVRDAIATGMEAGGKTAGFGLLAEPVATAMTGFAANMGRPGVTAKINLQAEWAKNNNGEIFPQAALIFHERLLADNEGFVNDFIALAEQSSAFANENPEMAGELTASLGSVTIPNGTVVSSAYNAGRLPMNFTHAPDAKTAVANYLRIFLEENANLIGGKLPEDSFYYERD